MKVVSGPGSSDGIALNGYQRSTALAVLGPLVAGLNDARLGAFNTPQYPDFLMASTNVSVLRQAVTTGGRLSRDQIDLLLEIARGQPSKDAEDLLACLVR